MRNESRTNLRLALTLTVLVVLVLPGAVLVAQEEESVGVEVCRSSVSGSVSYHYRITNRTEYPLVSFLVGISISEWLPQLSVHPVGCSFVCVVPETSYTAPPDWEAEFWRVEEEEGFFLDWSVGDGRAALPPGETLDGFTILVPEADERYEKGPWTAYPNVLGQFSGTLEVNPEVCPQ